MSEKKVSPASYPQLPSAPVDYSNYGFTGNRGPPPSYEESQKNIYPQHAPPAYPQGSQFAGYPTAPSYPPGPSVPTAQYMPHYNPTQGYPMGAQMPNFQQTMHQQQYAYSNMQQSMHVQPQTLEFDAGARFKGKGAGSITVPPPPPGYLPTPAQLAAMQGQPVHLKKKKNSFF